MEHEALLYKAEKDQAVQCFLCAHRCYIKNGERGKCLVRINVEGHLKTLVFGDAIVKHVDPIEKKPLYHFYPGSLAYSVATPGCNFKCKWCQNWEISQLPRMTDQISIDYTSPAEIVKEAKRRKCLSIAYTYTEPTVFFEYTYAISRLAKQEGIFNVYVTNGYMTNEMLEMYHPFLDAANVDIKAFSESTYQKYVGAHLKPVLETCKRMKELGIWLEITTLVIPGINDDLGELADLASFIVNELGADTPWHISRYYPNYEITDIEPTPTKILDRAAEIGQKAGLNYVYQGNLSLESSTRCPHCHTELISRRGFQILRNKIDKNGRCPVCDALIEGVGLARVKQKE